MSDIFDNDYWSRPFDQLRSQVDINVWFRSHISNLNVRLGALQTDFNSRVGKLEGLVQTHSDNIKDINNAINNANNRITSLSDSYDKLKANNDGFVNNVNKVINDFRSDLSNITGSINTLMASVNKNSQDIIEIKQVVDPQVINQLKQTYNQLLEQLTNIAKSVIESDVYPKLDTINKSISSEQNRATAQENSLSDRITGMNSRINTQQQTIDDNYASINNAFTNHVKKVTDSVKCIDSRLDDEIERANSAEVCLQSHICNEKKERIDADNSLCDAINTETDDRKSEDTSIRQSVTDLGTTVSNNYSELKDSDKAINGRLDEVNTNIANVNKDIAEVNNAHDGMKHDIAKNSGDISSLSTQVAENVNNIKNEQTKRDEWAQKFTKDISDYYGKTFTFDDLPSMMAAPMKFRTCSVNVTAGQKADTNLNIAVDNDVQFYALNTLSSKSDMTSGSVSRSTTVQRGRGTVVFNYDRSSNGFTDEEIKVVTTEGRIYYVYFNTIKHDSIANKSKYIVEIKEV